MSESKHGIQEPTCIGGPFCGQAVDSPPQLWNYFVCDEPRNRVHLYERRAPTDRAYYFKGSRPLYHEKPETSA